MWWSIRCASTTVTSTCWTGPGSASTSTSAGCGAGSRNSRKWRRPEQDASAPHAAIGSSAHFQNNDPIAAGIGCRPQFLDLICRYSTGIISPRAAHKRQDSRDLLLVQLNAELRHAVRIRHAFYDKRFRAVEHEIDERRRVRVEHGRVARQRRHEWRLALAVGAMASGA